MKTISAIILGFIFLGTVACTKSAETKSKVNAEISLAESEDFFTETCFSVIVNGVKVNQGYATGAEKLLMIRKELGQKAGSGQIYMFGNESLHKMIHQHLSKAEPRDKTFASLWPEIGKVNLEFTQKCKKFTSDMLAPCEHKKAMPVEVANCVRQELSLPHMQVQMLDLISTVANKSEFEKIMDLPQQ